MCKNLNWILDKQPENLSTSWSQQVQEVAWNRNKLHRCITSDIQLNTAEAKSCEMEFVLEKMLPDTCNTIQSYTLKFLACLEQIALCEMSNKLRMESAGKMLSLEP